ncbi:MAG TPA: hypothetical protein DDY52_02600 [Candidatus Moranbacteria bacterium]|nr:MAG: transcriptional regulator TrmB [Candidatus Moranbacteria bacterium GW2011_GWF1_34_10]HBI17020.1 hypothetical protein [Candidatus Moranbacteria bacterium]
MEEIFKKIGLSKKEIKIFVTLLEMGPQKASFLARNAGIERANIYYHLEGLRERGLVSLYTEDTNTTYFKAEPVRKIVDSLKIEEDRISQLISEAEFALPELEQLQKNSLAEYPKLRFYDNLPAIEKLYHEIIGNSSIEAVANIDRVDKFFHKFGLGFFEIVKEKKIYVRELIVDTQNALVYKKNSQKNKLHQVKILNKTFNHQTDILIFGNFTAFISYNNKPTAFVIEDNLITNAQREIFNELWRVTK